MRSLRCFAPAKLNLALAIGPRAAGGLHPVCSWMVTIDLYDELLVTRLPDDRLSRYAILWHDDARRTSEIDWSVTRDLAVRAHLALEARVGRPLPVQLKLDKRIPVGGGLGGGSSDAAAMLRAVRTLFDLDLDDDALAAIGADLGADVPFLVRGGSGLVTATGVDVEPQATLPDLAAVIVLPDLRCDTGAIYGGFDRLTPIAFDEAAVRTLAAADAVRPDALFNDLTRAAVMIEPALERHLADLSALAERPAHLTGSGATFFVLCDDELHAEHLARAAEDRLGLPALAVRTALPRAEPGPAVS